MACLVKDSENRSPFWICCYTSADGRRLKKSTKQTERAKALEVCLGVERAEKIAGQGALTATRVRELVGEILKRATGETLPFHTAEDWLREWLKNKQVSKSAGTHTKYAHTVTRFIAHLGNRAALNVEAITPRDISNFRDAELATGKHPNTVRQTLKQLRMPFTAARKAGIIVHSPCDAIELPAKFKHEERDDDVTREAFTPEQVRALMDAALTKENGRYVFDAAEEWRGAILFGYYTGARLLDVARMIWNRIDLPSRTIRYKAKKTGKLVTVPIHPELETYLLGLPAPDTGKAFVFPHLAARGTGGRNGLSMAFSRIMARARVAGEVLRERSKEGQGRTVRSLSFHSLRHSFNSALANAGVSQELRMALTGHASPEMNKTYTHHEIQPLREAIQSIPGLAA